MNSKDHGFNGIKVHKKRVLSQVEAEESWNGAKMQYFKQGEAQNFMIVSPEIMLCL